MSTRRKPPQNGSGAPMREPVTLDGTGRVLTPTPLRPKHIRLNGLADVKRELAKVYRSVKCGEIPPEVGTRLTYILGTLGKVITEAELEARVAALEKLNDDEDA